MGPKAYALGLFFGEQMEKFSNNLKTSNGKDRAFVDLKKLETLWLFSNSLCNLNCPHCYVESSPKNDSLSFITIDDVNKLLSEMDQVVKCFGITGGEPFLNPDIIPIITRLLETGSEVMILSNGLLPLLRKKDDILELAKKYGESLSFRISLDDPHQDVYEAERGHNAYFTVISTLKLFSDNEINFKVAGRQFRNQSKEERIFEYKTLFRQRDINLNSENDLIIFPEMSDDLTVPEITTECWDILQKDPNTLMCANERMVIKRKGEDELKFVPCTLLPREREFELGSTLAESKKRVYLNHRFCAQFCVLGGASCSSS